MDESVNIWIARRAPFVPLSLTGNKWLLYLRTIFICLNQFQLIFVKLIYRIGFRGSKNTWWHKSSASSKKLLWWSSHLSRSSSSYWGSWDSSLGSIGVGGPYVLISRGLCLSGECDMLVRPSSDSITVCYYNLKLLGTSWRDAGAVLHLLFFVLALFVDILFWFLIW